MELYVGLDVSLKETSIGVVDGNGEIVSEGTVISEPSAIAEFVKAKARGAKRIGLETGPTTTWLWHELRALGLPVICIDARHAKAALSMQINKSDRNDAVGLARIMRCGWYKEVQVKSVSCHEIRAVLNSRAQLVKIKRDLENQIRGLLKNLGLVIGKAGGTVFRRRVEELLGRHGLLWEAVRPLLEVREKVRREIAALYRKLLDLARNDVDSRRHDRAEHRPDHRLSFPLGDRRAGPLPALQVRRRLCRTDAAPLCLGRGRLDRADLQTRRSNAQDLPLRGRRRAAHPGGAVVQAQSLGSQAVEAHRLQEGQGRRGKEAGGHAPSHVA